MKKLLAFILSIAMLFSLAACGGNNESGGSESSGEPGFVKPESYASVVKLTINPEFNVYLDKDNKVLAIEALNDDAKIVKDKLTVSSQNVDAFVKEIIIATNEAGFVKENAAISVTVTEIKDESVNAEIILSEAKTAIESKTAELQITITVETKVEIKSEEEKFPPADESKNEESSNSSSGGATTPPANETTYSKRLIILDEISKTLPLDPTSMVSYIVDTLDFESPYLVDYDKEGGLWFEYTISEADFLNELQKYFVVDNDLFSKIKEIGSFNLGGPDTCEYKNGAFSIKTNDSWGGGVDTLYYYKKLIDNKNGTITIYYAYILDQMEQPYIELTYTYSGSAGYEFVEDKEHTYAGDIKSTSKSFIDSLCLKSIKQVESFPGNTEPQKNIYYNYMESTYYFFWYEIDPNHIELYGCGGEFDLPCSCGEDFVGKNIWNYDPQTKTVTCRCGQTVMTDAFLEGKLYR